MAALDTFDWFVSTGLSKPDEETKGLIDEERASLLSLRNEDERQRSVEQWMHGMREYLVKKRGSVRKPSL